MNNARQCSLPLTKITKYVYWKKNNCCCICTLYFLSFFSLQKYIQSLAITFPKQINHPSFFHFGEMIFVTKFSLSALSFFFFFDGYFSILLKVNWYFSSCNLAQQIRTAAQTPLWKGWTNVLWSSKDGGHKQSSTCNFTNKNGEGTFSVVCVGFVIAAGIFCFITSQLLPFSLN